MTDVTFAVLDIAPEPYAVSPILTARVGVAAVGDEPIHAIALRCQIRIDPLRRPYTDDEAEGLTDLFGPRERWATTQHTFLWQHASAMVPGFSGATQVSGASSGLPSLHSSGYSPSSHTFPLRSSAASVNSDSWISP